jgi:hypothetical protein
MSAFKIFGVILSLYSIVGLAVNLGWLNSLLPSFIRSPWIWNPIAQKLAPPNIWPILGNIDPIQQLTATILTIGWCFGLFGLGALIIKKA